MVHPYLRFVAASLRLTFSQSVSSISQTIRANPAPPRLPIPIMSFSSPGDSIFYALGSDKDIGGYSTVNFSVSPPAEEGTSRARFWGDITTRVHPSWRGKQNSGYAAFRTRTRRSLFGEVHWDVSRHRYLYLRVRAGGEASTRVAYFVNLQTETPVTSDIWQHRLLLRGEGEWEDVMIPFRSFVQTNYGVPVPGSTGEDMNSEHLRTVGISILANKFQVEGPYELWVETVQAVNEPPTEAARLALHSLPSPLRPPSLIGPLPPILPSPVSPSLPKPQAPTLGVLSTTPTSARPMGKGEREVLGEVLRRTLEQRREGGVGRKRAGGKWARVGEEGEGER